MKLKNLFQVLTLLALVFSVLGASRPVQAATVAEPVIVSYDMTVWNATYPGIVNDMRYEKWSFNLTETTSFVVTAVPTAGNLVPLISLLDVNGNEVSTLASELDSTQPAGKYYLLIKPQSGSGNYNLTLRQAVQNPPASVSLDPATIKVGETSIATVSLGEVPTEGYSSAEFTCTYDPALVEVSEIADAGLFGTDAVMVVNGPANGSFIVAIAGSNGKKATTNGSVFTFKTKGLKAGEAVIRCDARVSMGNGLISLESVPATLSIAVPTGTLKGTVTASKPVKVCAYDANDAEVECEDANSDGTFSMTLDAGVYTVAASAEGFLKAEGSATVTGGAETAMSAIALLAGDIDGNGAIDQFDAMTIGMGYNTGTPAAADLNNDANIDVLDLELLAANYHKTGPTVWE